MVPGRSPLIATTIMNLRDELCSSPRGLSGMGGLHKLLRSQPYMKIVITRQRYLFRGGDVLKSETIHDSVC
jgi:hypothetical protein